MDHHSKDHSNRKQPKTGMSYNEVEEYLARTTGGHNTKQYSNTNTQATRRKLESKNSESNPY